MLLCRLRCSHRGTEAGQSQRHLLGHPWSNVTTRTADSAGVVRASVKPSRTTYYRWVFTATSALAASRSATTKITVLAAPKATLSASQRTIRVNLDSRYRGNRVGVYASGGPSSGYADNSYGRTTLNQYGNGTIRVPLLAAKRLRVGQWVVVARSTKFIAASPAVDAARPHAGTSRGAPASTPVAPSRRRGSEPPRHSYAGSCRRQYPQNVTAFLSNLRSRTRWRRTAVVMPASPAIQE